MRMAREAARTTNSSDCSWVGPTTRVMKPGWEAAHQAARAATRVVLPSGGGS